MDCDSGGVFPSQTTVGSSGLRLEVFPERSPEFDRPPWASLKCYAADIFRRVFAEVNESGLMPPTTPNHPGSLNSLARSLARFTTWAGHQSPQHTPRQSSRMNVTR